MVRINRKLVVALLVAVGASLAVTSSALTSSNAAKFRAACLSLGTTTDRSWAQGNFAGCERAAKKYNIQVDIVPNLINPDQYLQQCAAFAANGYNYVQVAHGAMLDSALKCARRYPKTWVAVDTHPFPRETVKYPPNIILWDPAQEHGSFQAGALAALVTKTGVVGGMSGTPFPLINRQLEAFELGARCMKSDVKVVTKWTNDWVDVGAANTAAQALMGQNADILFTALDGSVRGVYQAAKQRPGTYVIGQYFDQQNQAPDVVLTSVLYNLDGINEDIINKVRTGAIKKLGPHPQLVYTLKNLNVGTLTGFGKLDKVVPASAKAKLKQLKADMLSGKIKVPDVLKIGKVGSAKKINVKSLGC
jgi:basic membrane lipoprotein Med (substrate-binding protein (PBP1-ABC) superfamily)